jgi:hypothetical protein
MESPDSATEAADRPLSYAEAVQSRTFNPPRQPRRVSFNKPLRHEVGKLSSPQIRRREACSSAGPPQGAVRMLWVRRSEPACRHPSLKWQWGHSYRRADVSPPRCAARAEVEEGASGTAQRENCPCCCTPA